MLTIIISGLTYMFGETKELTRRGADQVEMMEGVRATMGLLSHHLQQVSPAQQTNLVNLRVSLASQAVVPVTNGTGVTFRTNILQNVFVLSRAGDEWRLNQFVFEPAQAAGGAPTLYLRQEGNDLYGTNLWSRRMPEVVATNNPALETECVPSDPRYRRVVEGVVHLKVLPYDAAGRLMTNQPHFQAQGHPPASFTSFHTNLPASVDLEVGILERETLEELKVYAGADLKSRANVLAFLAARPDKVHLFRQRVPIHAVNRIVP